MNIESITSKSGRSFELPSDEEDRLINAAIAADPDTYEPSEKELSNLRRVGRPPAQITKERITIRLSPEVTQYFRATGKGWQTKIDKILLDYITTHQ